LVHTVLSEPIQTHSDCYSLQSDFHRRTAGRKTRTKTATHGINADKTRSMNSLDSRSISPAIVVNSTRAQIIRRTALEYNAKRPSHCYLLSAVISIRKRISYIAQQSSNVSATWPMSRDPYSLTVNRRDAQNWSSHAACPSYHSSDWQSDL